MASDDNEIEWTGFDKKLPSEQIVPPTLPPVSPPGGGAGASSTGSGTGGREIPPQIAEQAPGQFNGIPEDYPRSGNYIFTVGRTASGKTTLQSSLLRHLQESQEYNVELDPEFASKTAEFNRVVMRWKQAWSEGRFPAVTERGKPREFRYRVTPHKPGYQPLDFGFIEISGEDFTHLRTAAEAGVHANLGGPLNNFLSNPECDIAFMFVTSARGADVNAARKTLAEDDTLFELFLDYLDGERFSHRNFRANSTAILVISNPEQARRRLEDQWRDRLKRGAVNPADVNTIEFAEEFLPRTTARLKAWDPRRRGIILPFSVGRVEMRQSISDSTEHPVIAEWNDHHARALFHWLYRYFNDRDLGPPLAARIWRRFLKSLSGVAGE